MNPNGETKTMKQLILIAALALAGCDKASNFVDPSSLPDPKDVPTVVGAGQVLTAPGVKVLVGPASIRSGDASFPLVVLDAPPMVNAIGWPAVTCLAFDGQRRLIAASGGPIPPKLHGGSVSIAVNRTVASVSCSLGVVPVEER
jgi:hypothetical protein